jgi:pimeloyl-ACP methyl ester carboxylesterase
MRLISCILLYLLIHINTYCQEKVTFKSEDGLIITADLYLKDSQLPFILLFHQDNSSRGEYREIAPKLLNLNYNCLAVDLRSGSKMNFVENETCLNAIRNKISHQMIDAATDIKAAIRYASDFNDKKVILFGSIFSASLSMIVANKNENVSAVIAFSPGELIRAGYSVTEALKGFDKNLFVTATQKEQKFVGKLLEGMPENNFTLFVPKETSGIQGAKALWEISEGNQEYWMELLMFFKKLNREKYAIENNSP